MAINTNFQFGLPSIYDPNAVSSKGFKPQWFDRFKDLATKASLSDKELVEFVDLKKEQAKSGLDDAKMQELFGKAYETYKAKENKHLSDAKRRFKGTAIAETITDLGKAGFGISQVIKGKDIQKNLQAPKYPTIPGTDPQLSTLLAKAMRDSEITDPMFRAKALEDMTNNRTHRTNVARASSGGESSLFNSYNQANSIQANKEMRSAALDAEKVKEMNQRERNDLLGKKIYYDWQNFYARKGKFNNLDYPEFKNSRDYSRDLINQGTENLFGFGDKMAKNVPMLMYYKQLRDQLSKIKNVGGPPKTQAFNDGWAGPVIPPEFDPRFVGPMQPPAAVPPPLPPPPQVKQNPLFDLYPQT